MIGLSLGVPDSEPLRVLALGAHSDDIEIGCGGLLQRLAQWPGGLVCHYEVFSASEARAAEAKAAAVDLLSGARELTVLTGTHQESYFPYVGAAIKDRFAALAHHLSGEFEPHLVLTHQRQDRHQDHRTISDLTWNAFRHHLVLEYEIPKWDGDMGAPNTFVPLEPAQVENKLRVLEQHFASQRSRPWFEAETFRSLMRLRGMECNAPSRYAEAFYARKVVL